MSSIHTTRILAIAFALIPAACSAQQASTSKPQANTDSAFAQMQHRGGMAMGVDQYASTHKFDITSDGGRIELQSDKGDSLDVAQIRAHLKLIQHAFAAGDFSTPEFVHMMKMPGTDVMSKKSAVIRYTYADLPRGGEVRISTADAEAKTAIAEFMKAQRQQHHSTGAGHSM